MARKIIANPYWAIIPIFLLLANFFGCHQAPPAPTIGKSGSNARMNIVGDYLYTISRSKLTVHNIANAHNPEKVTSVKIDGNIETLFPLKDKLLIGAATGMFIYDISEPSLPRFISSYSHITSCDPVVSENNYAYVTLRNGTSCRRGSNELHILDIKDVLQPKLVSSRSMKNPHGLGIDNHLLFVTDGKHGFDIFDVRNPQQIKLLKQLEGLNAVDVITQNPYLYLIAEDGLYIYDYAGFPEKEIKKLSKISIEKTFSTKLDEFYKSITWWHLLLVFYILLICFTLYKVIKAPNEDKLDKVNKTLLWIVGSPIIIVVALALFVGILLLIFS